MEKANKSKWRKEGITMRRQKHTSKKKGKQKPKKLLLKKKRQNKQKLAQKLEPEKEAKEVDEQKRII